MKIKKRLSIVVAFMLLFMITFPVTGAFAAENSKQKTNSQQENTVKQKNIKVGSKTADQTEKSNGDVKAATTENETNTEEASAAEKEDSNSEQETTNQPGAAENSDNQEGNGENGNNASGKNNTQEETNAEENEKPDEDNASEGDNAPEEDNASQGDNAPEEDKDGDGNNAAEESRNESTPADNGTEPGNENKSTQIHLHIDKCVNPVETAFVQIDGQWEEMTNPGSSPLYKSFDDGEFIKDDVSAFKLIFTTGEELVIPVSEVRVGVEAEGSVNYWLDICELPVEEPSEPSEPGDSEDTDETMNILSMIRIVIDETPRPIEKVTLVMMGGKRIGLERINELFSLTLTEEIELELIRGLEITSNGETKLILLSQIESLDIVESVLTLQLNWDMEGEMVEEEAEETESEEAESDEDTETPAPGNNSGSGNTSDGTTTKQVYNGEVLPQTGESSRTMFYVLGFLIAAGGVMLRFRNPLRN
ncbi:LPXTG cell wall anchor domain-containing protein [Bacillus sp. ISL-55]|uniref:LPXTG cell wall anchor domain-containing protein n=1 Tax=Bacillus sp. ISL-55 TaxID=2819134 RepID=UPI001BEA8237|nr:LPXTG cell wall anchor domain-containing protein [Bacillus sp. ISL-55]MBT2694912.1 LPXTG cell wall anchor domain-containing protein [Bacillus sp. ISL-55]